MVRRRATASTVESSQETNLQLRVILGTFSVLRAAKVR
jgi:hypothetical protein